MRIRYGKAYGVDGLCRVFGYSRQAYYERRNYLYRECLQEEVVVSLVRDVRKEFPRMGARKMLVYLEPQFSKMDLFVGRDSFLSLLERNSLLLRRKRSKRKTTYSGHWMRKYPNLIRNYTPTAPNQLWASDITYVEFRGGFRYLSLITDVYSHKVVGWNVAGSLNSINALRALEMALKTLPKGHQGLIHHSDRGVQYCCNEYVELLRSRQVSISMTESGDPLENPVAERMNGILKTEWLDHVSIDSARDMAYYVGHIINLYNTRRPHLSIDYLTPAYVHETGIEAARKWKNTYSIHGNSSGSALKVAADGPVQTCQAISGLTGKTITRVKLSPDVDERSAKNCKVFSGRDIGTNARTVLHPHIYPIHIPNNQENTRDCHHLKSR